MIHIEINNESPTEDWLHRADAVTAELIATDSQEERQSLIDAHQGLWTELKDFLLGLSEQKCWYSESNDSYVHLHVDHFRPKKKAIGLDKADYGGYWWLAFKWINYRICGPAGNVRKKDKFAVRTNKANSETDPIEDEIYYFLDPTEEEDVLKITFDVTGQASSVSKKGWDAQRCNYTIKELNLNFKKLKENRKVIWQKCSKLLTDAQNLMAENDAAPSAYRRGQIKEKLRALKQMTSRTEPFSATARACLKSSGLDWAKTI